MTVSIESGKDGEGKVLMTPQSPAMRSKVKKEEVTEVEFASKQSNYMFWIDQPRIFNDGNLMGRHPGYAIKFERNKASITLDKIYQINNKDIAGRDIVKMMENSPFCGNNFIKLDPQTTKETAEDLIASISSMSFDEVKNKAIEHNVDFTESDTKEQIMVRILENVIKNK